MSRRGSSSRLRATAAIGVALCLAGSACVKPRDPGVRVDSVKADIVFGVPDATVTAVPPRSTDSFTTDTGGVAGIGLQVPFQNKIPDRFRNVAFGVSPEEAAASSCRDAGVGSAPSDAAPENATNLPAEGLYRFKVRGTQTIKQAGQPDIVVPIKSFEPRIVRAVKKSSETRWTFDVVSPNGDGGVAVSSYDVNTQPTQRQASAPYVGQNPVRAGEPNVGITLTRIRYYDGNGNQKGEFNPATPLVYLPLPVLPGETFNSVGVDPKSGQTIRFTGLVKSRQAVDACGELVDGWLVHLDVTDSAGNPRSEDVILATGMGGLLVSDHNVESSTSGTVTQDVDVTYSLGQTTPSSVPDSTQ